MPVDFLNPQQQERYGRFHEDPSPAQLARYFHLDDADNVLIRQCRGDHNRLGFALQLGTVRFLGTFLPEPTDVPSGVIAYVAAQLELEEPGCLELYRDGDRQWDHAQEIRQCYGYRDFADPSEGFRLVRWLYTRAWLTAERPSLLFDLATARLVAAKVVLPGVTMLGRLVARVRDRAANRMWRLLAGALSERQKNRLRTLLKVPEGQRQSNLDRLREGPTRFSGPILVDALGRLEEIRGLGVGHVDIHRVPAGRLKTLARYAAAAWAQNIERMPMERQVATLLAFARSFEAIAMDDAMDVLDLMLDDISRQADRNGRKERMRTLGDLDAAALQLCRVCSVIMDDECPDPAVRSTALGLLSKDKLQESVTTVLNLARKAGEHYEREMVDQYGRVRIFLPSLLRTVCFMGAPAGQPVLQALQFLGSLEKNPERSLEEAPLDLVSRAWLRHVVGPDQQVDRQAYTLCLLECVHDSLKRRDLFVHPSDRWNDPRAKLLQGAEWRTVRPRICKTLGLETSPEKELQKLGKRLDEAYLRTAGNFPDNAAVRIEKQDQKDVIVLTGLDKLEEPPSLIALREQVNALLPQVDLPELLLEIQKRTGFVSEFTHISEGGTRAADLDLSICAVLLAEACNIDLEPLVRPDEPALTRSRLLWVKQNYMRAETIISGSARLADAQNDIPTAHAWGDGGVVSADGLRFIASVPSVNAGPNVKYFGAARGITFYNFTSDQFTGLHGIVVPGTLRDSLVLLAGLLEQATSLEPHQIMTDTAGASDVVFGLFALLGYQFSPRLADMKRLRLWRMNPKADYGILNPLSRHCIDLNVIPRNWDDMLRVTASLKMGTVSASELMGSLLRTKRPSALTRAIANWGRIDRTLHLLTYLDDETYRRLILTALNHGEGRNGLMRVIYHGRKGEVRQRYREAQEDQLNILGLVANAVVHWNTLYIDAALNHLRAAGYDVKPEDVMRLSPLVTHHINFLGRYTFLLPEAVRQGKLRPFRASM